MRRNWGSGSIYRAANGRWRVAVSAGFGVDGHRIRREWQVGTQAAARAKLRELESRVSRGLPAEESGVTLAQYVPDWLAAVEPTVRPSTFAFYRTLATLHLDELAGLRVARIRPPDVRRLVAARQAEGYASRTVRGVLDVLRMILRQAEVDGLVERNVAALVDPPRLVQAAPVYLTGEQARRFLDATVDDNLFPLYATALGTGLRRGELLALTWHDVDLAERLLVVRRSKTDAGIRTIPLADFVVDALSNLERRPGPLFVVSPWHATRHVAVVCKRAGVPSVTFHQLRHSAASILKDEGVDEWTIQSILGHTKVGMTRRYTHVTLEQQRQAVGRLGKVVSK